MSRPNAGASLSCHQLMRILHTESSMGMGGQEYRVLQEVKGMETRGHEVFLAVPQGSQLALLAAQSGLRVETTTAGIRGWITSVPSYLRMINRWKIEVVNTHGSLDSWTASIAGRIAFRKPIIIRTRHKSTPVSQSLRHRFLYGRLPHVVITAGETVRQELIARNGLNPSRVISIPTGVDLDRFHPQTPDPSLRKSLGVKSQGPLVGTIAFLRPEKGLEVLIEAVRVLRKTIPTVECLIVGEGEEKEKASLTTRIRELGLEHCVHMVGFRRDIPALLSVLDVVVIPSLFGEGIPQTLTQALAMARPVVASTNGGIPEVIQDGVTGLLIPPGNPAILSEKIAFLLNNPALGARMGQIGQKVIQERYSFESMLIRTEDLYRHLFLSRSSAPMSIV
jgi:glycosyltransferase involved in cell wall biosynthesis